MPPQRSPEERLVHISLRVTDWGIERLDGRPVPALRRGSIVDLVCPLSSIKDDNERAELMREVDCGIAECGEAVMLGLQPTAIPIAAVADLILAGDLKVISPYVFIQVVLKEQLVLRLQERKLASLLPCECEIPILKRDAISLNHAYTVASEHYELQRKSHTANVFERAYLLREFGWTRLDGIREQAIVTSRAGKSAPQL